MIESGERVMEFIGDIDFIVPWVDGTNSDWQRQYKNFEKEIVDYDFNGPERLRSTKNLLVQWVRGVTQYAEWVHEVVIVVDRLNLPDIPDMLLKNTRVVCHDEFIPQKFLPTFNSNVIELFIDKVPGISENFVLFNDDCYVINTLEKKDFFDLDGVPVDSDTVIPLNTSNDYSHILLNNLILINRDVSFSNYKSRFLRKSLFHLNKKVLKSMLFILEYGAFVGWHDEHMPIAYRKEDFQQTFKIFENERDAQGNHRFRSRRDISHLLVRFWRLAKGVYHFRKANHLGVFLQIENDNEQRSLKAVLQGDAKVVCINDRKIPEMTAMDINDSLERIMINYYKGA